MKKQLIKNLHAILKPLGFVRKSSTWNRKVGDFVDVINLQTEGSTLMVNLGVLDIISYQACWLTEIPLFLYEYDCTVRIRLGKIFDKYDKWWKLSDESMPIEVPKLVQQYGVPFLDSLHSVDALVESLEKKDILKTGYPPEHIYFAVLKEKQGKIAEAKAIIEKLNERLTPSVWKDAAEALLVKYGNDEKP